MKAHRIFFDLVVAASIVALLWHGPARADALGQYQPTILRKAELALQHGYPDHALALLRGRGAELRRWRAEAQGSALMCRAYFEQGDYASAERACNEAVLAGGESAWSYVYHRGVMRLLLGRIDEGVADLRRAASMDPPVGAMSEDLTVAERF
jgi:tetratricopeptide (TPR) repeat protein